MPEVFMHDVYQINVAKTEFREAYNTADVDRLLSVFASGGFTNMSDGQPSKYGEEARAELRNRAAALFAEYSVKLAVIVIDVVVLGKTAYDYGWHEFILTPRGTGDPIRKRERYFELWTEDAAGSWKISLHINNPDVREEWGGSVSRWFLSEEQSGNPSGNATIS
jgi:ketosteroid isomerase-like protein